MSETERRRRDGEWVTRLYCVLAVSCRRKGLNVGAVAYEAATTVGLLDANHVPFAELIHKRARGEGRTPEPHEYLWYHSILRALGDPVPVDIVQRDVKVTQVALVRAQQSRTQAAHVASAVAKKRQRREQQDMNKKDGRITYGDSHVDDEAADGYAGDDDDDEPSRNGYGAAPTAPPTGKFTHLWPEGSREDRALLFVVDMETEATPAGCYVDLPIEIAITVVSVTPTANGREGSSRPGAHFHRVLHSTGTNRNLRGRTYNTHLTDTQLAAGATEAEVVRDLVQFVHEQQPDDDGEHVMLRVVWVTYNGTAFDIPHLHRMCARHGVVLPGDAAIDILHVVRTISWPTAEVERVESHGAGSGGPSCVETVPVEEVDMEEEQEEDTEDSMCDSEGSDISDGDVVVDTDDESVDEVVVVHDHAVRFAQLHECAAQAVHSQGQAKPRAGGVPPTSKASDPISGPPSLQQSDLYEYLFKEKLVGAHDATVDVAALVRIVQHEVVWVEVVAEPFVTDLTALCQRANNNLNKHLNDVRGWRLEHRPKCQHGAMVPRAVYSGGGARAGVVSNEGGGAAGAGTSSGGDCAGGGSGPASDGWTVDFTCRFNRTACKDFHCKRGTYPGWVPCLVAPAKKKTGTKGSVGPRVARGSAGACQCTATCKAPTTCPCRKSGQLCTESCLNHSRPSCKCTNRSGGSGGGGAGVAVPSRGSGDGGGGGGGGGSSGYVGATAGGGSGGSAGQGVRVAPPVFAATLFMHPSAL